VIDTLEPPRLYVTHSVPTPPEQPHITEWVLADEQGGTRLTITFSGYELEPEEARQNSMEQTAFGFGMMLENVRSVVMGLPLPMPAGF
jgi:hypothetical protein